MALMYVSLYEKHPWMYPSPYMKRYMQMRNSQTVFFVLKCNILALFALGRVDNLLLHMFRHLFRSLFPLLFLHLLLV